MKDEGGQEGREGIFYGVSIETEAGVGGRCNQDTLYTFIKLSKNKWYLKKKLSIGIISNQQIPNCILRISTL